MFKWLKDKITRIMIENLLKSWLAGFKAKNPQIWAVIAMILTAAKAALESLVANGSIPDTAGWLEWVFWLIALLLGAGGVAAYKYRKELSDLEDDPHVAHNMTVAQENRKLKEENEVLKEIIAKS